MSTKDGGTWSRLASLLLTCAFPYGKKRKRSLLSPNSLESLLRFVREVLGSTLSKTFVNVNN